MSFNSQFCKDLERHRLTVPGVIMPVVDVVAVSSSSNILSIKSIMPLCQQSLVHSYRRVWRWTHSYIFLPTQRLSCPSFQEWGRFHQAFIVSMKTRPASYDCANLPAKSMLIACCASFHPPHKHVTEIKGSCAPAETHHGLFLHHRRSHFNHEQKDR